MTRSAIYTSYKHGGIRAGTRQRPYRTQQSVNKICEDQVEIMIERDSPTVSKLVDLKLRDREKERW